MASSLDAFRELISAVVAADVDEDETFFFTTGDAGLTEEELVRGVTRFSFIVVDLVVVVLLVAEVVVAALGAAVAVEVAAAAPRGLGTMRPEVSRYKQQ